MNLPNRETIKASGAAVLLAAAQTQGCQMVLAKTLIQ
jgi:hypothetical protein